MAKKNIPSLMELEVKALEMQWTNQMSLESWQEKYCAMIRGQKRKKEEEVVDEAQGAMCNKSSTSKLLKLITLYRWNTVWNTWQRALC